MPGFRNAVPTLHSRQATAPVTHIATAITDVLRDYAEARVASHECDAPARLSLFVT
jgi:hypothetical protein